MFQDCDYFKFLPLPPRKTFMKLLLIGLFIKFTSEQASQPNQPSSPSGSPYEGSSIESSYAQSPEYPHLSSRSFYNRVKRELVAPNHQETGRSPSGTEQQGSNMNAYFHPDPSGQSLPSNTDQDYQSRIERDSPVSSEELVDQQLQLLMHFTNGLILTEAVATNQMSFSDMVVDLMIIEQMKDCPNWINVLSSTKIDEGVNRKIEESIKKLDQLKGVIENGLVNPIDADLITTVMAAVESFSSIKPAIENVRKLDALLAKAVNIEKIDFDEVRKTLESLIMLPNVLEAFQDISDPSSDLNSITLGIKLVKQFAVLKTFDHLTAAIGPCNKGREKDVKFTCLKTMERGFAKLKIPVDDQKQSLENCITIVNLLGIQLSKEQWENAIELVERLELTEKLWQHTSEFLKGMNDTLARSNEFRQMTDKLKLLKNSAEGISRVADIFSHLQPINDIATELRSIYEAQDPSNRFPSVNSSVSFFESFQGLTDGIMSISDSLSKVGSAHEMPANYLRSNIDKRAAILRDWTTVLTPIVGSAGIFRNVPYFNAVVKNFNRMITDDIMTDLATNLTTIEGCYSEILKIGSDKPVVKNLLQMLINFNNTIWKDEFLDMVKLHAKIFGESNLKKLTPVLSPLPKFMIFASEVQTAIEEFVLNNEDLFMSFNFKYRVTQNYPDKLNRS